MGAYPTGNEFGGFNVDLHKPPIIHSGFRTRLTGHRKTPVAYPYIFDARFHDSDASREFRAAVCLSHARKMLRYF